MIKKVANSWKYFLHKKDTHGIFLPKEKARIIYTWETSSKGLCSVFKVIKAKFGIFWQWASEEDRGWILTSENEASTSDGRSDLRLRRTTATLPQSDKGRTHTSVNDFLFYRKENKATSISKPFNSQDLISNSPYCLPYSSFDVSFENLVLDQLVIS